MQLIPYSRSKRLVVSGRPTWGAGCVNGARPVLGGGDAQSIKSKLYVKLERESSLYSPQVAGLVFSYIKINFGDWVMAAVTRLKRP
ncbi:hypothetical protein Q31a_42880 [Aureliella helgolandensis]|uniref:Uncharacterized protein n=1 Tax=Aureliella helgolandensis TaxID=2527968 RepID=A0A518GBB9_9BACT|nr:hypothetical protein Q31a_42880 [Aureliella helgolandensis]